MAWSHNHLHQQHDEPDILNLLEKALNMEGYHSVVKIDNGHSAVKECLESQPDFTLYTTSFGLNGLVT